MMQEISMPQGQVSDMRSFSRGCNCLHHFRPSIQSPTYKENWMDRIGYDFYTQYVLPLYSGSTMSVCVVNPRDSPFLVSWWSGNDKRPSLIPLKGGGKN